MFDKVLEFHEKFGHPINTPITSQQRDLRCTLISEETIEVMGEMYPDPDDIKLIDKKKLTKELCDLLYVTLGTGVAFGLPLKEVFEEVHKSNMSKLGEDGKPVLREDGKVLKGSNYKEPDLEQFFK